MFCLDVVVTCGRVSSGNLFLWVLSGFRVMFFSMCCVDL
jgi:hypothetical protein